MSVITLKATKHIKVTDILQPRVKFIKTLWCESCGVRHCLCRQKCFPENVTLRLFGQYHILEIGAQISFVHTQHHIYLDQFISTLGPNTWEKILIGGD
jgi:hypothetical protein